MKRIGKNVFVRLFVLVLLTVSLSACANPTQQKEQSESEAWPGSAQTNVLIGRGINLGNALEAPNEGDWGVVLQESYFREIKKAGFQSVRIPIRWSAHAQSVSPYTIDPRFFDRVDWAVNQALRNDLTAIINVHHYEALYQNPQQEKERFLALWRQIASHFQKFPSRLLFEILNEPHGQLNAQLWNVLADTALKVIRRSNAQRVVIIGTANWGGLSSLDDLQLPDDSLLIFTFHYYEPFHFTHQGAEWVEGSDAWLGTTWEGSAAEKQTIRSAFDRVQTWAGRHHIPVFLGEFGAYGKADMDSRVRWTSFVAREAERRGFSWAYWEFCSGFGAYDPNTNQWRPELLHALIPEN